MGRKKEKEAIRKMKIYKRNVIIVVLCVIVCAVLLIIWNEREGGFINKYVSDFENVLDQEGEVKTISTASLENVFDISELSTADYIYNGIAKVYKDDGTTIKYYVAYEGKVKAGIDFDKIVFDVDEEKKVITITIPDIRFTEITVNPGTLEYIFKDKKSETETVHQEAFKICKEDLAERVDKEKELVDSAKKNSIAVVEALVTPWVEQMDKEYKVKIQ